MKKFEYKNEDEDEFVPTKEFWKDWHKQDPRQQNPFLFGPYRTDIRRINGVITNFDSLVEEDIKPPKWMLRFMAKGGIRKRDHSEPWPTNAKRSQCPRVAGMVQVICERFGMIDGRRNTTLRGQIAAHLECTPRTVGNYLSMTGNQVEFHVDNFRWIYPEKNTPDMRKADQAEMLNTLEELTKYHYDDDELDLMNLCIPFTPLPNDLVERTPRFCDAQRVLRRKEDERITMQLLNQVNDVQEELLEHMREIMREEMQELLDFKSGSTKLQDLLNRWQDLENGWQDLQGLWQDLENRWQEPENRWQLIVNQWQSLQGQLLGELQAVTLEL